jgi:16S rRNA processing protein RimM
LPADLVRIGRIGRPHGVTGALTLRLDDPDGGFIGNVRSVLIVKPDGTRRSHSLTVTGRKAESLIVRLGDIEGREGAAGLTNAVVLIERSELDLDPGDLLVSDLPGLTVVSSGAEAGTVLSTYDNGVHDVMVVETPAGLVDFPVTEERIVGLDDEGRLEVEGFADFLEMAYEPARGSRR